MHKHSGRFATCRLFDYRSQQATMLNPIFVQNLIKAIEGKMSSLLSALAGNIASYMISLYCYTLAIMLIFDNPSHIQHKTHLRESFECLRTRCVNVSFYYIVALFIFSLSGRKGLVLFIMF